MVGAAVAHPAVAAGFPQQVHTLLRAALRHHAAAALVVKHGLLRFLVDPRDLAGMAVLAEKAFLAIARDKHTVLPHIARSLLTTVPIECQAIVYQIDGEIDLKLATATVLCVLLPFRFAHVM